MQWCLVQTGAELFDRLHAYGLGILLAHASGQPIEVRETSCTYTLTGSISAPPSGPLALLDDILSLPTPQEIATAKPLEASLPVANLDGLLTVLFTTTGVRALSVADLWQISRKRLDMMRPVSREHSSKCRAHLPDGTRSSPKSHSSALRVGSNASSRTTSQAPLPSQLLPMPTEDETSLW